MRALGISLALILVLVVFGTYVFKDTAAAQGNLVADLLDLPAPPPPNPLTAGIDQERDDKFYSKRNPPADDAPINDLVDYWSISRNTRFNDYVPKPSPRVIERLKDAVREKPDLLPGLIPVFPDDEETIRLVKSLASQVTIENEEESGSDVVTNWLKFNSDEPNPELEAAASAVKDENEYVTNKDELMAFAKKDPERAAPIINRLYADSSQPVSQTLAKWALYKIAISKNSLGDIEKYREELMAVVENRDALPGMRDLALDALVYEKEWAGRDDWYFGLMADESLAVLRVNDQVHTGLTTIIRSSPPDKYADKMIELLKSGNPTIRNAAVRNLSSIISKENPEVVRALLPWLEDPKWATEVEGERSSLIEALQHIEMPESLPGLIETLDQTVKPQRRTRNSNTNSAPVSIDPDQIDYEVVALRIGAAKALGTQKDPRGVPALRRALNKVEIYERGTIVRSIWLCKGFSIKEQVDGLESYVKSSIKQEMFANSNSMIANSNAVHARFGNSSGGIPDSGDIGELLGEQLIQNEQAEEALVSAVVDRIDVLTRRDPPTAERLVDILEDWGGAAINAMMLRNLKNGKASLDSVVKLLSLRKELMEGQSSAVYDARGGNSAALGLTTCILNNNGDYDAILAGENAEAKTAMLACARLVRADLPINSVIPYLDSADKILATAAERYLESNDSHEARMAVLARHPGKAKVLGSTVSFAPGDVAKPRSSRFLQPLFASIPGAYMYATYMLDSSFEELEETEKRLRKEVLENESLLGIYSFDSNFIRIFSDKAVFSWEDDEARYYERTLEPQEFERFKNFLVSNNADSQPPYFMPAPHHGESSHAELLMLGRQGGRRVFFSGPTKSKFFAGLDNEFEEMRKPPAKLHYWLEKDIPGLEILFSDKNLNTRAIWKNGADMRVLIHDQEREDAIEKEFGDMYVEILKAGSDYSTVEEMISKRRAQMHYVPLSWYSFAGKPSAPAVQPPEIPVISTATIDVPPDDDYPYRTRSGNMELRADHEGLVKIVNGQPTKIKEDFYHSLFLVPGGKWAFAGSYKGIGGTFRINLQTGKEFELKTPDGVRTGTAVAYLSTVNKVLLTSADRYAKITGNEAYYLVAPETGAIEAIKGEFRPLAMQTIRGLQKGPGADEYWAAMPGEKETQVGIYNIRTFSFKPVQKVPKISFSSMDMWVDDKEGKIYLTYSGHLLSIPLKK